MIFFMPEGSLRRGVCVAVLHEALCCPLAFNRILRTALLVSKFVPVLLTSGGLAFSAIVSTAESILEVLVRVAVLHEAIWRSQCRLQSRPGRESPVHLILIGEHL